MTTHRINGFDMHVVEMNPGGDRPVVMVHGLFTSLSVYFFTLAPKLAKRRRVILYDLRGHGLTLRANDGAAGAGGYDPQTLSGDLIALMDRLGLEKPDMVGYSYGGAAALCTALLRPERVGRLALIDTPTLAESQFDRLAKGGMTAIDFADGIAEYSRSTGIAVSGDRMERELARFLALTESDALTRGIRQGRRFFEEARLEDVSAQTLLLYGIRSPYLRTGRSLSERLPHASLRVGLGDHNIPVQQPGWLGRKLGRFFAV